MRVQQCRNGCGTDIVLKEDQGKWKPYDYDEVEQDAYELHNCPNSPYNQKRGGFGGPQKPPQQQERTVPRIDHYKREPGTPTDVPKHTQGGMVLDTKRILTALVDLTTEVRELKGQIESAVLIDSGRYENQMSIVYDQLSNKTKENMFKTASQIDTATVNHSKIADDSQNFLQPKQDRINKTKFVDESKEKTLDERIPDSDDYAISEALKEEDENEGVIEDI